MCCVGEVHHCPACATSVSRSHSAVVARWHDYYDTDPALTDPRGLFMCIIVLIQVSDPGFVLWVSLFTEKWITHCAAAERYADARTL